LERNPSHHKYLQVHPQPEGQRVSARNQSSTWWLWPPCPHVKQKLESPLTGRWHSTHVMALFLQCGQFGLLTARPQLRHKMSKSVNQMSVSPG